MAEVKLLRCRECAKEYQPSLKYVCEECFGPLDVVYDYEKISLRREDFSERPKSIWRYFELLPIANSSNIVNLEAGYTPLQKSVRLAEQIGLKELYIKNDTVNPTYSFKDRPASIGVSKAVELQLDAVGCASTGNLAGATAAYAARAGIPCFVFIPHDIEKAKVTQALAYGAKILSIEGTYDDANRLAAQAAEAYRLGIVNINMRPYYTEGSKTLALEVSEQLGWQAPDHVIIPVGSGAMLHSICKGFEELVTIGLLDEVKTKITAAQPSGCAPIVDAFKRGETEVTPVESPNTIAKSLAIGEPGDGFYALKKIREYRGYADDATNQEIIEAVLLLARTEGIFAEPAGGVPIAVLKKLVEDGKIDRNEKVVCYVTGNGLKTPELLTEDLPTPSIVKPEVRALAPLIQR